MKDEAQIAAGLSEAQKRALQPCAANRTDLPKTLLVWRTMHGHRYPTPKLNNLGYAVRKELESQ